MRQAGQSSRFIAKELGLHHTTVGDHCRINGIKVPSRALPPESAESEFHASIREALKQAPMSIDQLADRLDRGPSKINEALEQMIAKGALIGIDLHKNAYLQDASSQPPGKSEVVAEEGRFAHLGDDFTHVFGFVTDNHLGNKHSRLDVLNAAYDTYKAMGIGIVYNAGNYADGEFRFNRNEIIHRPGMDHQLDYVIDKYPQREGIETHYIDGDDHEGWYTQREGIAIGKYLRFRAEEQGRTDLKYLGYAEADVSLAAPGASGTACMRVVHPGGGSAYAISYTDQKRVESYQGGEKPQVELVGHYHKFNHGYPREVHTVQGGCTCDQTLFMRKKKIQAHVGFSLIKIQQHPEDGHITRFAVEWFPFYNRGLYEKRYN